MPNCRPPSIDRRSRGAYSLQGHGARRRLYIVLLVATLLLPPAPARAQETPGAPDTPAAEPAAAGPTLTATVALTATESLTAGAALTGSEPATPALQAQGLAVPVAPLTGTGADANTTARIEQILANMSAADRVGQLFVVTFRGADTSFESAIAELIYAYRVGGVVLSPENSNFSNAAGEETARQVAVLANKLQALAYGILLPDDQALQPVPNEPWPPGNLVSLEREIGVAPPNLPLLVGVEQLGDQLPGTSLRRGFSPLPSQLAIGSTWDLELARQVGATVGRELRAVGINLLLGPGLDVVHVPRSDEVGSLSVFSFGGSPSWVGRMGRSYITGVHQGSEGRVATVARHFPGQGDVDRLPADEVATIQRTMAELEQIALPPFLAVTRPQPVAAAAPVATAVLTASVAATATAGATTAVESPMPSLAPSQQLWQPLLQDPAVTDILMSSQMRYSALQAVGGPVAPLGLAPEMSPLLNTQVGGWRNGGGLVMSGPLGVLAVRRTYAPALDDFPARRIALDAFNAGNDLLYLSQFALSDDWDEQMDNYRAVIAFFQERYRADPDFAAQVDYAVRRILGLKLRQHERTAPPAGRPLLPAVPLSQLLVQEADLALLPGGAATVAAQTVVTAPVVVGATPAPTATEASTSSTPTPQGGAASALGAAAGATTAQPAVAAPTTGSSAAAQTARKALTQLFPDPADSAPVPTPQAGEQIVIISDSRLQRECDTCTAEAAIDPDAIAREIISLYGPEATGQINPADLVSLTFSDLDMLLPEEVPVAPPGSTSLLPTPTPTSVPLLPTEQAPPVSELLGDDERPGTIQFGAQTPAGQQVADQIEAADWLIFALLDPNPAYSSSDALNRYLRLSASQLAGKRVVVFALNAPSFLDATEISKLTLYLGVYSKSEPFLESSVRALFRSVAPEGAPALNVPGTRFASLAERLLPNPGLTLPLQVFHEGGLLAANAAARAGTDSGGVTAPTGETGPAVVSVGDTVQAEIGPILDHNQRPVPDGTVVSFAAEFEGAELAMAIAPALTLNGRAVRAIQLERGGVLRLAATAGGGSASSGEPLILNVLEPQPAASGPGVSETSTATEAAGAIGSTDTAAAASPQPEIAPAAVLTPTGIITATAGAQGAIDAASGERVNVITLLLSLLTMLVSLSLLLLAQIRVLPRETLFKSLLWAVIVGLLAYLLYGLGWLPGSDMIAGTLNAVGAPLVVFLAMLLPLFWLQLRASGDR